jgi:cellulose synthase/poly-beta-1,6-N-acetylglucosamine synthase-like glycosyltransferase
LAFSAADRLPEDARFSPKAPEFPALPRLHPEVLAAIVQALPFDDVLACLKTRALPLPDGSFAVCGKTGWQWAGRARAEVSAVARPHDFLAAVQQIWGARLCQRATWQLDRLSPQFSARRRFSDGQAAALFVVAAISSLGLATGYAQMIGAAALLTAALLFLAAVALRIMVLLPEASSAVPPPAALPDEELPIYTVLVPLFRETRVLDGLLGALGDLDYPHASLDIKIIIEQQDHAMQAALAGYRLPARFEVLTVPAGSPQTKPRALNYGLLFARGSLVTIYDAEDLPSPNQLRVCAAAFAASPRSLACLQARLSIYNSNENWLARQFALEYASLFGEILPGLARLALPLPLGGTSNHFRADVLRHAGGWDPCNVTEDADLGIRLARLGYRSSTVDSDTFEEACIGFRDWTRQRARWLKGFLQTWLVHMRAPRKVFGQLGFAGFCVLQAVTLGVVVSALLHPVMLGYALWHLVDIGRASRNLLQPAAWIDGFGLMLLLAGYGASIWIAVRTIRRQALPAFWQSILTLPLYWMLLTPAAWLAVWQFATDLHGWNKTPHGRSRLR